jgi:kynurenine formamidase
MNRTLSSFLIPATASFLSGCNAGQPDVFERLSSGNAQIVDMTHALSADMPFWPNPNGNPFRHDTLRAHPDGAPMMAAYATPEHHGTHLDAPIHGGPGQASVDQLTASELFGPAVVIDVREHVAANPDYQLSAEDLRAWEAAHGAIPNGAIVLLRSGWDDRWTTSARYQNVDARGVMHFPGFSEDAARYLMNERRINGIGTDTPSVDHGPSRDFPVHGIVNGGGKYHLENVANVGRLPATGAFLIVAPIKIAGGSGGQVRIFGVLPE